MICEEMSQLGKLEAAEDILEDLWIEIASGHVDDGLLQPAVNAQIFINRIVWKLNGMDAVRSE